MLVVNCRFHGPLADGVKGEREDCVYILFHLFLQSFQILTLLCFVMVVLMSDQGLVILVVYFLLHKKWI